MSAKNHNIQMVEIVASGLKSLLTEIVFVGGATTTLYLSEQETNGVSTVRPTDDVDCVIEVATRTEYAKLEKRIRELGFKHATEQGSPICRWSYSGVTVDIMPTDPKIIGFSNRWYKNGIQNATEYKLPSGKKIRLFTVPYFLGSKIEAFKGRGKNDYLGSRDFEDIITMIDGRENIRMELASSPNEVKDYMRKQFNSWMNNEEFLQGISAHLPSVRRSADGARRIIDIVRSL